MHDPGDILDPGFAEHHGRIVKTIGDGLLVEFASAVGDMSQTRRLAVLTGVINYVISNR